MLRLRYVMLRSPSIFKHFGSANRYAIRLKSTKPEDKCLSDVKVTYEPITTPTSIAFTPAVKKRLRTEFKSEHWVSHGFCEENQERDTALMHYSYLMFILTMAIVMFFYTYKPNSRDLDWVYREACLRLQERESAGLTPIDPNYIDPEILLTQLPPDEGLDDASIII